jgi:hypothetical protein
MPPCIELMTQCALKEVNVACEFDNWAFGSSVYEKEEQRDDAYDRVRYMIEECDNLQGIHLLVDANSGWGGFGEKLLTDLRDYLGTYLPRLSCESHDTSNHPNLPLCNVVPEPPYLQEGNQS